MILQQIRYYILVFISWKISMLQKLHNLISGKTKFENLSKNWSKGYDEWKKSQDKK